MDLFESPLDMESGDAIQSSLDGCLPCNTVRTTNSALFKFVHGGLEVGTRIHVLIGACDDSADVKGLVI